MPPPKPNYCIMFYLLMWKNFLLQLRSPGIILYQTLFTALACSVIALLRYTIQHAKGPGNVYEPFCVFDKPWNCTKLEKGVFKRMSSRYLAYSPDNSNVEALMENFARLFKGLRSHKDGKSLESIYKNNDIFAGIQFEDSFLKTGKLPKKTHIVIRYPSEMRDKIHYWKTDIPHEEFYEIQPPRMNRSHTGETPNYYKTGFLTLQQALAYYLLPNTSREDFPKVVVQRLPYGPWIIPALTSITMEVIINVIFFLHIIPFAMTIKHFSTENDNRLVVFMKIMGLPKWLQWLCWFVTSTLISLVIPIMITVIVRVDWKNGTVFSFIETPYIFMLLVLYLCSLITFAFLMSLCFPTGFLATIVGVAVFILSAVPFNMTVFKEDSFEKIPKYIFSLIMNVAVGYGFRIINHHQGTKHMINGGNLWEPFEKYTISFGEVMVMLFVDTIIYFLLALYVDALFPGKYGIPRPWYLFQKKSKKKGRGSESRYVPPLEDPIIQSESPDLEVGIEVKNVSKSFGTHKVLRNIHLKVYKGKTTVLIGHSSSGKSILARMILGLYRPTSGTIRIKGYDTQTELRHARAITGCCFQNIMLFGNLTPREHLTFYSRLKMGSLKAGKAEVQRLIEFLDLIAVANHRVKFLTTGIKRKVCIAIAFCGNPEIIILDEPTTGLDPNATRTIWNFVHAQKIERTILILTYDANEAEALGERIAVLAGGELQCYGSLDFLNKEYGAQYQLEIIAGKEYKAEDVEELFRKYVPDLQVSTRNTEYRYLYYFPKSASAVLESLSRDLQSFATSWGIEDWNISVTTLKDIVEKVCKSYEHRFLQKKKYTTEYLAKSPSLINLLSHLGGRFHGHMLIMNQYLAMIRKMFVVTNRYWILIIIQIALPILFLIIEGRYQRPLQRNWPSLALTVGMYEDPLILISGNQSSPLVKSYLREIKSTKHKFVNNITKKLIGLDPENELWFPEVGATFENDAIVSWFDGDPHHSSPVSLSLVLNSIGRYLSDDFPRITFHNHPLPYQEKTRVEMMKKETISTFPWFVVIGLTLAVCIFGRVFVIERVSLFKQRQFHAGLSAFVFWSSALIFDLLLFIVILSAFIISIHFNRDEQYGSGHETLAIFLLTFCFGIGSLVFIFFISLFVSTPSVCFAVILGIGIITGFVFPLCFDILFASYSVPSIYVVLKYICLLSPFCCLGTGMHKIVGEARLRRACLLAIDLCSGGHQPREECSETACKYESACCEDHVFFFTFEGGILMQTCYLLTVAAFIFTLIVLHDSDTFKLLYVQIKLKFKKPELESIPIKYLTPKGKELRDEFMIVLEDVAKSYRKKYGVRDIFLGLKPHECFGLLGLSGSGKSTIFRLLMGIERPSNGQIWVCGMNPNLKATKIRKLIGYCPQNLSLMDDLTVKELVVMFCLIRGIPLRRCKKLTEQMANRCGFKDCIEKYIKELSNSDKRKVSFAVTIIGDPPILCLDEPTEGMDPASKRMIWDIILKLKAVGKCIILITSSMSECEVLCTSVGILLKGKFECMGLVSKLKEKYTKGYTLRIRTLTSEDFEELSQFIEDNFMKTTLIRRVRELAVYDVEDSEEACKIYTVMEREKDELCVQHYTVEKKNLEHVFLKFTTDRHLRF